jgi:hypothetical protein
MKLAYGSCSISMNLNFSMSYSIIIRSGQKKAQYLHVFAL